MLQNDIQVGLEEMDRRIQTAGLKFSVCHLFFYVPVHWTNALFTAQDWHGGYTLQSRCAQRTEK